MYTLQSPKNYKETIMDPLTQILDINRLFSFLGSPVGDDYEPGKNCQATLETILSRLYEEDKYVRNFRRLIANSQVLKRDLLPLFYYTKNDFKILDLIIKILENLMIPVECLLPIDIMIKEDAGRSTIYQLNWLLTACKEAFLNPCATKSVLDYIKLILRKEQQFTTEGSNSIRLCLLLLRNLLHIPEVPGGAPGGGASHQNQIIWNLFTQHIDRVLIQLMTNSGCRLWGSSIAQVISLMYKDQQSSTIHKLLYVWCECALPESSEDDESNTSPQEQAGDSDPVVTSDPNSDNSDSDQQKNKTDGDFKHHSHPKQAQAQTRMTEMLTQTKSRKAQVAMRNKHGNSKNTHPAKHRHPDHAHPMGSHFANKVTQGSIRVCSGSDSGFGTSISNSGTFKMEEDFEECGYLTQNPETNSSSSNEEKEPTRFGKKKCILQKTLISIQNNRYSKPKLPLTYQARKDLHREKLMERSKAATMSIKTFLNHTPTEEDISLLLKEFTLDFLLKTYGKLIAELKIGVLSAQDLQMDVSHFTWLIMFFLPFATQLEVDLDLISPVLSIDIISYLTYEGVHLCEELQVAKLDAGEKHIGILSKLYLNVSCLKEIIVAIEGFRKFTHLTAADQEYLIQLQEKMCLTNDLKYLFILLLHHFDPQIQSQQFLQEMVLANHNLMVLTENCPTISKNVIQEHLRQFASEDIMKQYGVLLACFMDNGEVVNNCIFTMMHHVAGDLEKVNVLFQPNIVSTFRQILDSDFAIREEWTDLMEYVIQKWLKFNQVKTALTKPTILVDGDEKMVTDVASREITTAPTQPPGIPEWTNEEQENLLWYFSLSKDKEDPIEHINQLFIENFGQTKTRSEIIENLWKQEIIQEDLYKSLLKKEIPLNSTEFTKNITEVDVLEGIQVIIDFLHAENKGFFIKWLQGCLLEACYAKLVVNGQLLPHVPVEPVAYYHTMLGQNVPLVTWNQEVQKVMQMEPSIWLLSVLNFHLPNSNGQPQIFARIPSEWTVDHLYVITLILGPLNSSSMKFDPSDLAMMMMQPSQALSSSDRSSTTQPNLHSIYSIFGFSHGSMSMADWQEKVNYLKSIPKDLEDKQERMSMISGDERDWDIISVCVSDEGAIPALFP